MDLLFSIFEGILLAAGPFCVFSCMGKTSDNGRTGNLFFRGFTSSDNSVNIIEGPQNITFSAIGGVSDIKIDNFEIAFGNAAGTSLTSSNACVVTTTNRSAIVNISKWQSDATSFTNNSLFFHTKSTFVCDPNGKASNNIMIGGFLNDMCTDGQYLSRNVMLGGYHNCIRGYYGDTKDTTIVSSACAKISCGSTRSTILSTMQNNAIVCSNASTIISSRNSVIGDGQEQSKYNTILAASGNAVGNSYGLGSGPSPGTKMSIISGQSNRILNDDILNQNTYNNIILGNNNHLCGDRAGYDLYTSKLNFIASSAHVGRSSRSAVIASNSTNELDSIYAGVGSSYNCSNLILSSVGSCLCTFGSYAYNYKMFLNSIISSRLSKITNNGYYYGLKNSIISSCNFSALGCGNTVISSSNFASYRSNRSIVLSSTDGISVGYKIRTSPYSSIISSSSSTVLNTSNSTVISSASASSSGSKGNPISTVSSKDTKNISGGNTAVISSRNSFLCASYNSVIISSNLSQICSGLTGSIIISSANSFVNESRSNAVISAVCSIVNYSCDSVILAGYQNLIDLSNASVIIGGKCNKICSASFSAIIGGQSITLTQSHTAAVESIFVKSCILVNKNLAGASGNWSAGSNTLSICKGIVTSIT